MTASISSIAQSTGGEPATAATSASEIIRFEGVGKQFMVDGKPLQAVENIDLSVFSGEILTLVGPSGCGKSTLLSILGLLDMPSGGEYFIEGVNVTDLSLDQAARIRNTKIGFIFQSFNLIDEICVFDNIALPLRYQDKVPSDKEITARVKQCLDMVGMGHRTSHRPNQLSGGQQQRIAISRALALDPQIMLFDEPTSALDPEVGLEVLAVMRELADEGMTMMVVTHEMRFAENVSNRVIVMADGEIIEQGESAQVMRSPEHPRVQQFLSAVRDR